MFQSIYCIDILLLSITFDCYLEIKHKLLLRFQGHSQRDTQVYGATGSDLDLLFPERIRHKTVGVNIYIIIISIQMTTFMDC